MLETNKSAVRRVSLPLAGAPDSPGGLLSSPSGESSSVQIMSPARILAGAMGLPSLPSPPSAAPPGSCCAMTGDPITHGYLISQTVTDATNEFLDTFRGLGGGYVSEDVARCMRLCSPRAGKPILSIAAFVDGGCYQPLISRTSALEQRRPCWSDFVHSAWSQRAGQTCCLILTTDTKKRLWPRARTTVLGHATALYLHDGASHVSCSLRIDWPRLLAILQLVESVYTAGFTKRALRRGLYSEWKAVQSCGMPRIVTWERALATVRPAPEFAVAALIAQKPEENK